MVGVGDESVRKGHIDVVNDRYEVGVTTIKSLIGETSEFQISLV